MSRIPPAVSVAVVCHNGEKTLRACLESLLAQDFAEPWELLVVDSRSTDATNAVAKNVAAACSRVRVIENASRSIPSGRNAGLRSARAPLLAYTDADCVLPPHWLRALVAGFRRQKAADPRLAGAGGGNRQPGDAPFYRALRIMTASPLGNRRSVQTEVFPDGRYVDSLAALNALYEKEALEAIGGFDEDLFPRAGEDEDLNRRLADAGRTLFFVPGCEALHLWRDNFRDWCANMYCYGYARAGLRRRHPKGRRAADLLPPLVPAAAALSALSPFNPLFALPLAGYLAVAAAAGLVGCAGARALRLWPRAAALFAGTHFCYGLGLIAGMAGRLR